MNMLQVKAIAKERDVKPGNLKKVELVQTIQSAEGNIPCFSTGKAADCGQLSCLWREDCN
jgi:hypothetical protein